MKNPSILSPSQSKPNPPKVDIFWDGVGGSFSGTVLQVQQQGGNSRKGFVMSVFIAAYVNVWQSDHGRQPGLLQPSAGNSPEDNANERCEEETESKHLFFFYRKLRHR